MNLKVLMAMDLIDMKKIVFVLCVICIVIDLVICFISSLYMDAIRDIAMLLLAITMYSQFFKSETGD